VLIADDERLSRRALRVHLEQMDGLHVAAECADGAAALAAIHREDPDLLFLDIEMPRLNGFEVLARLEAAHPAPRPGVVFVTAYDEHAIRAFEVCALDYVLKPFDRDRLRMAVEHAAARRRERELAERMEDLIESVGARQRCGGAQPARRILVRRHRSSFFVPTADIDWIEAFGNYVRLHVGKTTHLPLFATGWKSSLALHLPTAICLSGVFLVVAAALRHYLFLRPEFGTAFSTTLLRYYTVYFNTEFLFYWGIVGVYSAFVYYRDLRERELTAERLRRGLSEARLRALQNQLRPHFLFNTLNAISGLALDGDTRGTVRTLCLLGDLLRVTLERDEVVVRLAEELRLLELYVQIQRVRFEDRLDVRLEINPDVLDAEIPTFLLQPIVENAIRHGLAGTENGWIEIRACRDGGRVRLIVTDSGSKCPAGAPRLGVGLSNCAARLRQLYGADHMLAMEAGDGGGVRVGIEWPLRTPRPRESGLSLRSG
jgi:two-component system LytT family sensor kinase